MSKDIIIIGAGRQGFFLAKELGDQGYNIIGLTDVKPPQPHQSGYHKMYLGGDEVINNYDPKKVKLVLGLSDTNYLHKAVIFKEFKDKGFRFQNVICDDAYVDSTAEIGEGVIIWRRAIVDPYAKVEDLAFIATYTSVEHDNIIGFNAYLSAGISLGGVVSIGANTMLGIGAKVIPGVNIGKNSILGAGSVLTKDMPDNEVWYGVPAKKIRDR